MSRIAVVLLVPCSWGLVLPPSMSRPLMDMPSMRTSHARVSTTFSCGASKIALKLESSSPILKAPPSVDPVVSDRLNWNVM